MNTLIVAKHLSETVKTVSDRDKRGLLIIIENENKSYSTATGATNLRGSIKLRYLLQDTIPSNRVRLHQLLNQ